MHDQSWTCRLQKLTNTNYIVMAQLHTIRPHLGGQVDAESCHRLTNLAVGTGMLGKSVRQIAEFCCANLRIDGCESHMLGLRAIASITEITAPAGWQNNVRSRMHQQKIMRSQESEGVVCARGTLLLQDELNTN